MENTNITNDTELSLSDVALKLKVALRHLRSKLKTIILFSLLGGALGLAYAIIKKPKYTAACSFVLEDGTKQGGLGQYSSLASLAGIDISGGGGGGAFQGDNIIELYKSRTMIERALLSPAKINGKTQLLIDRYIDHNNLKELWKKESNINNITFTGNPENFNRDQDSIITAISILFNKSQLNVARIDKKLSIIKVEFISNDESFSKEFDDKLVETVNNFYIQTKTKKAYQNVLVLQHQADSVRSVLNASINGVASAIDNAPNANPALLTLKVPSQKKQVDVQANSAIYSEMVKNLELSKISLRQETPLIQIIDQPILPLYVNKLTKLMGIIIGTLLGGVTIIVFISVKKIFSGYLVKN